MSTGSYNFEQLDDASFQTTRLYQQSQAIRGMEAGILRAAGLKPSHDVLEVGSGPGFVSSPTRMPPWVMRRCGSAEVC